MRGLLALFDRLFRGKTVRRLREDARRLEGGLRHWQQAAVRAEADLEACRTERRRLSQELEEASRLRDDWKGAFDRAVNLMEREEARANELAAQKEAVERDLEACREKRQELERRALNRGTDLEREKAGLVQQLAAVRTERDRLKKELEDHKKLVKHFQDLLRNIAKQAVSMVIGVELVHSDEAGEVPGE